MDWQLKRFDLPDHNNYNLGIRECIEQIHYDTVQKMNDLIMSAFRSLGYTRDWVFKNRNRIAIDHILGFPFSEQNLYKLDGKPLFQVSQTTEIRMEGGVYKFLANWEVRYFKEGEN